MIVMHHSQIPTNEIEYLESDLRETDDLRFKNLQALAWLIAENLLLRSILTGTSQKPVEQILKDGKPIIEQYYHELAKNEFKSVDKLIQLLIDKERYQGA